LIEAPVNGGRNYRQNELATTQVFNKQLKIHVNTLDRNCSYENKSDHMLETPMYPLVLKF